MSFSEVGAGGFGAPRQFHQLVAFAAESGINARPFSTAEETAELIAGWSSGPAGVRASIKLDAAMSAAYRAGQIDRAREAMRDQFQADPDRDTSDFYRRERLVTILIQTGARATYASDGPASTLIMPADLVELAAEFVPIDDREDARFEAEQALRDYHWQIIVADEEADRLAAIRSAATERLADATSLDDLADSLRADFGIEVVDAGEIAHAAAKGAARWEHDAHAAALLEADRLDARRVKEGIDAEMANLRIVTSDGERVTPAENFSARAGAFALEAAEAGHADLAAAARRAAVGMNKPAGAARRMLEHIDFDETASLSPPSWLVKGLLPKHGIGLLYGESGAGKSFASVYLATCAAWGLPAFGKRTKQGAVLYIAAEGGSSVKARFRVAHDAMQGALAAARLAGEHRNRAPIRIVTETPNLSREGDPVALLNTIERARADFEAAGHRLALVVLDTWHAALCGGDENGSADTGAALTPIREASEAGGFHFLIVHHPGKDAERGARGSNALPAAADVVIAVRVPGHEGAKAKPAGALRIATVTKMRDGDAGAEFAYSLRTQKMGVDEDGDDWLSCAVEPRSLPKLDAEGLTASDRDFMEAMQAALGDAQGERVRVAEVRLRFYASRPEAKSDAKRVAFNRALAAAVKAERIAVDQTEDWAWLN